MGEDRGVLSRSPTSTSSTPQLWRHCQHHWRISFTSPSDCWEGPQTPRQESVKASERYVPPTQRFLRLREGKPSVQSDKINPMGENSALPRLRGGEGQTDSRGPWERIRDPYQNQQDLRSPRPRVQTTISAQTPRPTWKRTIPLVLRLLLRRQWRRRTSRVLQAVGRRRSSFPQSLSGVHTLGILHNITLQGPGEDCLNVGPRLCQDWDWIQRSS